ncbi:MAG: DNA internalization-related competence protein ComEC/Rec2 [Pseudomonadales bacterium]
MVVRVFAMLLGIAVAAFLPLADHIVPTLSELASEFSYGLLLFLLGGSLLLGGKFSASLLAFCAGILYASIHATQMHERLPWLEHEGELFEITGIVLGLPRTEFRYGKPVQRFDVRVYSSSWPVSSRPIRTLRLSWYEGKSVAAGQQWKLRVAVKRPRGFANPGSFDYQHYLHSKNIDATGTVRWGEHISNSSMDWREAMLAWRGQLADRLMAHTESMHQQRLVRALALGDGKALSAQDWNLLSRTGTTHLFVVSGLHIGMVAAISYLVSLPLTRLASLFLHQYSAQRLAALVSLLCAFAFAWLAGFGLPTQRAVLMLGIALLARHFAMPLRFSYLLTLAALLILLTQPLSIRSPGFILSFTAVAALLYGFSHRLESSRSLLTPLFKAQWISFVALSSILLFQFQSASLLMPLANLLAIPVLSFVALPLVMLVLASVLLFKVVPQFVLSALDTTLTYMWRFLQWIELYAGDASLLQRAISPMSLLLLVFACLLLLAPAAIRARSFFAIPVFSLPLLYASVIQNPSSPTLSQENSCSMAKLTVLDVGQGLSVVFTAHGRSLVYDTGARFSKDFDSGAAIVAPYLRYHGIGKLDTLVLSHSDNDHAGGVAGLLENISVTNTLASYRAPTDARTLCKAGLQWQWDTVHFSVLSPTAADASAAKANNDQSCVIRIDTPGSSILLTGDVSRSVEHKMLSSGEALSADILLMPHHGSKSSSSAEFIAAVAPRYAIASAGYKNRFNHPHTSVVERYANAGVTQLNTAKSGAIEFDIPLCKKQTLLPPEEYRSTSNRFWLRW